MPQIVVSPSPAAPGTYVTICYVPLTSGVAYVDVTWDLNPHGSSGVGLRLTPASPCVEVRVPENADQGIVSDESGAAEDALIKVSQ